MEDKMQKKKRVRLQYVGFIQVDYYRGRWTVAPSYEDKWHRAKWNGKGYYDEQNKRYVYVSHL